MSANGMGLRIMAVAALASALWVGLTVRAEEKKAPPPAKSGKVVGILTEMKDTYLMVKPEGKAEPERFLLAPPGGTPSPSMQATVKTLFIPNLVALKWQRQEEEPVVTEITAIRPKIRMGTSAGTVVTKVKTDKEVYFDVKPAGQGFTERYWPPFVIDAATHKGGFDTKVIDAIGTLNVGDKVRIQWYYDERKRSAKLQVIAHAPAPKATEKERE